MRRWIYLLAMAIAVPLLLPVSVAAQNVPPGQAEADQYSPTIPKGSGDRGIDGSREAGEVLGSDELAALEALGEDGAAAAALAGGTAPSGQAGGSAALPYSGLDIGIAALFGLLTLLLGVGLRLLTGSNRRGDGGPL